MHRSVGDIASQARSPARSSVGLGWEPTLSVIVRRSGQPRFLSRRLSKHLTVLVSRRAWAISSRILGVLVGGARQTALLAADVDHGFVKVPEVAAARVLAPEAAGVLPSELHRPAPNSLVGDDDATFQHRHCYPAKAQRRRNNSHIAWATIAGGNRWRFLIGGRLAHASHLHGLLPTPELAPPSAIDDLWYRRGTGRSELYTSEI